MDKTWAIAGTDLLLNLGGTRVRAGLEAGLRAALQSGRLAPGTRLPSSRALAADLGIARNTVAEAYGQLSAEGWLTGRTGSGTWVAGSPGQAAPVLDAPRPQPHEPRYDLRPGVPDLSLFSRRAWLQAARKALNAAADNVLGYPDPRGLPELRAALAGYLARARGVAASPGQVVVCSGFGHGLAVLCRVVRARGARAIAVEAYGHQAHRRIAEANGLRTVPLPVDGDGAVVSGLTGQDATGTGCGAVLLTPAHQFPLGITLAPQRRRDAIAWAIGGDRLVIEDDYDGEFRYDRQPVGALQALAPGHVVYAGTASKSLVPGRRLGWLVVPPGVIDEVLAAKEAAGAFTSALDQLTLAELITSGSYDRQVRQARLSYRRRRDRLVSALGRDAPHVRIAGISAGLHALALLPPGQAEDPVIATGARHGIAIDGLGSYRSADSGRPAGPGADGLGADGLGTDGTGADGLGTDLTGADGTSADGAGEAEHPPALVVGYARPPDHAFTTALARLSATLSAQQPGHAAGH